LRSRANNLLLLRSLRSPHPAAPLPPAGAGPSKILGFNYNEARVTPAAKLDEVELAESEELEASFFVRKSAEDAGNYEDTVLCCRTESSSVSLDLSPGLPPPAAPKPAAAADDDASLRLRLSVSPALPTARSQFKVKVVVPQHLSSSSRFLIRVNERSADPYDDVAQASITPVDVLCPLGSDGKWRRRAKPLTSVPYLLFCAYFASEGNNERVLPLGLRRSAVDGPNPRFARSSFARFCIAGSCFARPCSLTPRFAPPLLPQARANSDSPRTRPVRTRCRRSPCTTSRRGAGWALRRWRGAVACWLRGQGVESDLFTSLKHPRRTAAPSPPCTRRRRAP
jgi:hypothetical protein